MEFSVNIDLACGRVYYLVDISDIRCPLFYSFDRSWTFLSCLAKRYTFRGARIAVSRFCKRGNNVVISCD